MTDDDIKAEAARLADVTASGVMTKAELEIAITVALKRCRVLTRAIMNAEHAALLNERAAPATGTREVDCVCPFPRMDCPHGCAVACRACRAARIERAAPAGGDAGTRETPAVFNGDCPECKAPPGGEWFDGGEFHCGNCGTDLVATCAHDKDGAEHWYFERVTYADDPERPGPAPQGGTGGGTECEECGGRGTKTRFFGNADGPTVETCDVCQGGTKPGDGR